jgi:hypothetical protein
MYRRDRSKTIHVNNIKLENITFSAVVQIGDVYEDCVPFSIGDAYGGYRGAPSFVSNAVQEKPIDTRLHYANQLDEDVTDYNIFGEKMEMFRPNIRGEEAR